MERPLSSRADISREIRGWSGFTLKALALVAVIGLVGKVVENIDTFGQALSGFMNGGKKTEDADATEVTESGNKKDNDFEDPK